MSASIRNKLWSKISLFQLLKKRIREGKKLFSISKSKCFVYDVKPIPTATRGVYLTENDYFSNPSNYIDDTFSDNKNEIMILNTDSVLGNKRHPLTVNDILYTSILVSISLLI